MQCVMAMAMLWLSAAHETREKKRKNSQLVLTIHRSAATFEYLLVYECASLAKCLCRAVPCRCLCQCQFRRSKNSVRQINTIELK